MPAVLTQLVYLKYRAGAPAAPPIPTVFQPSFRVQVNSQTTHRGRLDSQTTHRVRSNTQTTHRLRLDA